MKINNNKYDANFTAGGLLLNEFVSLEKVLLSDSFDELIKLEETNNNYIGVATLSARKRILSEVRRRYKKMPFSFWEFFYQLNQKEQKLALFFVILKTYPIVMDIHIDVALNNYKIGSDLEEYDITMIFDEIASRSEKVASWSDSTLKKINNQYRKVIRDIEIYDGKKLVSPTGISDTFWNYFIQNNEAWFIEACFVKN